MRAVNSDQQHEYAALRSNCVGSVTYVTKSYLFLALDTGKIINPAQFTEIPMMASVITRVDQLGSSEPELLTWTNRRGEIIGDGPLWDTTDTSNNDASITSDVAGATKDDDDDVVVVAEED
jgi:hypothetical protein